MWAVEDVSDGQKKLMEELKEKIEQELTPVLLKDKTLYYRFSKACDFDLKNAEAAIRKHIQFRKKYKADAMELYLAPKHITEYFALSFLGYDKEGSIVCYSDLGKADHKGIISLFTLEELMQHFVFHLENNFRRQKEQNNKVAKSLAQWVMILNVDKFSLFQSTYKKGLETFYEGTKMYFENYPETLKSIYIINASFYFNFAFALIKPILGSKMLQNIHIFGNDGWKETLLDSMDADVLPAFLGGTRTDPDGNPMCYSFVVHGKKVPEELYSSKKKTMIHDKDVKKLTISRSSFSEIEIDVNEENTNIEWEFETKTKDIGFGLYYRSLDAEDISEAIIPLERIDTALASEIGMFKCNKIGTYIIVFDNSYSWLTSKELYYRIKMVKADASCVYNVL